METGVEICKSVIAKATLLRMDDMVSSASKPGSFIWISSI